MRIGKFPGMQTMDDVGVELWVRKLGWRQLAPRVGLAGLVLGFWWGVGGPTGAQSTRETRGRLANEATAGPSPRLKRLSEGDRPADASAAILEEETVGAAGVVATAEEPPSPDTVYQAGTTPWFPRQDRRLSGLSDSQRRTYRGILSNALRSGVRSGRAPTVEELKKARESLAKARALGPEDPECEFIAGLIALAASEWSTAETHFEEAVRGSPAPHVGALVGTIYAQLSRHQTAEAVEGCGRVAGLLAAADADTIPPLLATATADWLGRACACGLVTGESTPPVPADLLATLPESLRTVFQEGYAAVAEEKQRLLRWTQLAPAELKTETSQLRTRVDRELAELEATEKGAIERRKAERGRMEAELKTVLKPLVQLADRIRGERGVLKRLDKQIQQVSNRPIEMAVRRPNREKDRSRTTDWDRRREEEDYRLALQREQRQRAQKANDLMQLDQQRREHQQVLAELLAVLEQGREERRRLEEGQAAELKSLGQAVDAAQRSRNLARKRLDQLQEALNDPAKLLTRAKSASTWLPLALEGQRDTLLAALKQP